MSVKKVGEEPKLVKQVYPSRPDWDYFLLEPSKDIIDELLKPPVFDRACDKACTKVISLLPKRSVAGHTGIGVGYVGETSFFFNFDAYFEPGTSAHHTVRCETSDLTTVGGLPQIGGVDLTHILRTPVMGPYVRASVFNEDSTTRNVEVTAYLST